MPTTGCPAQHPIWAFLRFFVGVLAATTVLTVVLWRNASAFDMTEVKSILEAVLAGAALYGGYQRVEAIRGRRRASRTAERETPFGGF